MAKYLLVYHGGGMAEGEEAQAKVMAAWGAWFQNLGPALADGGNPVSQARTIAGRRISFGRRWRKPSDRLQPDRGRQPGRGGRAGQGLPGARERRQHRGRGNLQRDVVNAGPVRRSGRLQAGNARVRAATARVAGRPRHAADSPTRDNRSDHERGGGPRRTAGVAWGSDVLERPMGRQRLDAGAADVRMVVAAVLHVRTAATTETHLAAASCSGSSSSSLSSSQARPRPRSSQPGASVARAARRASRRRSVDINTSLGGWRRRGGDRHRAHVIGRRAHQRPRRRPRRAGDQRPADLDRRHAIPRA